jgi:hypothetical protein
MSDEADAISKLVQQVGPTIAVLAGVSTSKFPWFLPGVRRALRRWELDIVFHAKPGSRSHVKSGNPDRLLYQMLKHVEALHDQLNDIIENGSAVENDVLLNVGAKLEIEIAELEAGAISIDDIQRTLSCFNTAISRAVSGATRPRGALPQVDRYPGLHSLVVNLQGIAQSSGGNFTAHRKLGAKGSIVKAIDEIRNHSDELGAYYLPGPDQHPVATYEKLLHYARSRGKGWQPAG